jgi:hypothetical protein
MTKRKNDQGQRMTKEKQRKHLKLQEKALVSSHMSFHHTPVYTVCGVLLIDYEYNMTLA